MTSESNNNYRLYGENSTVSLREADPVQCCLSGKSGIFAMETCAGNPLRREIELCPKFMSQRCARNWDDKCDIYLNEQTQADFTGKKASEFLKATASAKFCRVDTSFPGSYCFEKCEQFNPTAPNSAQVCTIEGDVVYRDSSKLYNLDTNYNWSGRLNTAEPIKFTGCKKTCDQMKNIGEADRVINECLDRGVCGDVISNLAQNIVANNIPFENSRLKNFIERYVIGTQAGAAQGVITPGSSSLGAANTVTSRPVAVPAVNPYLQPDNTYVIQKNTGNFSPQPIYNQSGSVAQQPAPVTEPFHMRYADAATPSGNGNKNKDDEGKMAKKAITYAIIAILAVLVIKMCK